MIQPPAFRQIKCSPHFTGQPAEVSKLVQFCVKATHLISSQAGTGIKISFHIKYQYSSFHVLVFGRYFAKGSSVTRTPEMRGLEMPNRTVLLALVVVSFLGSR